MVISAAGRMLDVHMNVFDYSQVNEYVWDHPYPLLTFFPRVWVKNNFNP